ncbi:MAG: hypothetical protein ACREGR_00225 [Minisyncoccia bacterium]
MRSFKEYLGRKQREYGEKFNPAGLAKAFVPFYENGKRIEVRFSCGTVKRGTVGVTTGWGPCFLLMLRKNSMGSMWTIDDKTEILKVIEKS